MDLSILCDALGNPTRYQIVKALHDKTIATCCDKIEYWENGASVGDVVKLTGLAQATVSQHLKVLENADLLTKEKRDVWSCYLLNKKVLASFLKQMGQELGD